MAMAKSDSVYEQFRRATTTALLRWVLEQCGNDRTRAAKLLGLSRAGLYKLLHQHDLLDSGGPRRPGPRRRSGGSDQGSDPGSDAGSNAGNEPPVRAAEDRGEYTP